MYSTYSTEKNNSFYTTYESLTLFKNNSVFLQSFIDNTQLVSIIC